MEQLSYIKPSEERFRELRAKFMSRIEKFEYDTEELYILIREAKKDDIPLIAELVETIEKLRCVEMLEKATKHLVSEETKLRLFFSSSLLVKMAVQSFKETDLLTSIFTIRRPKDFCGLERLLIERNRQELIGFITIISAEERAIRKWHEQKEDFRRMSIYDMEHPRMMDYR